MYKRILSESTPATQFFFTAVIILVCGISLIVVAFFAGLIIFGMGFSEMQLALTDLTAAKSLPLLKYFQVIQTFALFIIPPFIVAYLINGRPEVYLRYNKLPVIRIVLIAIAVVYVSDPLINWLSEFNSKLVLPEALNGLQNWIEQSEQQATKLTEAFLKTSSVSGLFFNLFMIGILPAVGEELLFRGVIQQLLKKWSGNSHMAIWFSAALFSALHMQFFGFLPRLLLGVMFGYMLEWSGTLWLPVIAHFVNNATAVVAYFLLDKGVVGKDIDKVGTASDGSAWLVILSILFLYIFFRMLHRHFKTDTAEELVQEE